MWCSFLYFNASVTTEDGESIKLRDSIDNFFNSRVWKDFKETLRHIYEDAKVRGWQNVWNDFVKAMDPEGEENSYQVSTFFFVPTLYMYKILHRLFIVKYLQSFFLAIAITVSPLG